MMDLNMVVLCGQLRLPVTFIHRGTDLARAPGKTIEFGISVSEPGAPIKVTWRNATNYDSLLSAIHNQRVWLTGSLVIGSGGGLQVMAEIVRVFEKEEPF